jgi:uncharacterized protein YpmB
MQKTYEVRGERKHARKNARNIAKKEGNVLKVKNVKKAEGKTNTYLVTGEISARKAPKKEKKSKKAKKSKKEDAPEAPAAAQ